MAYGVNAPFGLRPYSSINGVSWTEKTNLYSIYADPTGQTTYNASIFIGDPVTWNPALAQAGTISVYLPARTVGAPGTYSTLPILGVFQGCEYTDINGRYIKSAYWPASTHILPNTQIKAYVLDDPDTVFNIQVSTPGDVIANAHFPTINATGVAYPAFFGRNLALDIGIDIDPNPHVNVFNPVAGEPRTGQSAFYAVASSGTNTNPLTNDYLKTAATLPLKAIGYTPDPRNIAKPGLTMSTTPYLNILVTINNHYFGHNTAGTTLA